MRQRSTARLVALIGAAALAVGLSGCVGASDADPEALTSASTEPTPELTEGAAAESGDVDSGSDTDADGESSAGGASSDGGSGSGSGSGSSSEAEPDADSDTGSDAAEDTASARGPAVEILEQRCRSGRLNVTVTASFDSGYREGIRSVLLERQNEYGVWLDADATWMGYETGDGDRWTGSPPGSKSQRAKDLLRITVKADSGEVTTLEETITVNC